MAKVTIVLLIFLVGAYLASPATGLGGGMVGGKTKVKDVNTNQEVQELGRYSVEQYNKQQQKEGKSANGGYLRFKKVLEAETQVVSGIKYYLKISVITLDGLPQSFDAEVVVKPWARSKELLNFAPSHTH